MLHSVFFALMVGSPTHPHPRWPWNCRPTHHTGQCTAPPPPGLLTAPSAGATVRTALPPPLAYTVY